MVKDKKAYDGYLKFIEEDKEEIRKILERIEVYRKAIKRMEEKK